MPFPLIHLFSLEGRPQLYMVLEPEEEEIVVIEEKPIIEEQPIIEEELIVEEEVLQPIERTFEYRVQIRAKLGNAISIDHLSNIYNIPTNQIRQDRHNGYYIYSVGSFDTYEQARVRRNELRSNSGVTDAFVVAFKNGSRLDKLP